MSLQSTDQIADLLTRIRNAISANKTEILVPTSKLKEAIVAILVKNGPSYAALGFGGEGFPTFTIASRTGEGLTSAATFTKRRRCTMSDSLCIR